MNLVDVSKMYKEFTVPKGFKIKITKKGQVFRIKKKPRIICAPQQELKKEQRRILDKELSKITLHPCAYGFVADQTIATNGKVHLGAKYILNIDMKDFFNTVTREQVYEMLKHCRSGFERYRFDADYITHMCTYKEVLPQGAPTSPALSNIVAIPFDRYIEEYCLERNCKYTRYADDISISGNDFEVVSEVQRKIFSLIQSFGWKVSSSKVRIVSMNSPKRRQEVTGVTINRPNGSNKVEPNVSKRNVRRFEAIVHRIECQLRDGRMHGLSQIQAKRYSLDYMMGYANFLTSVNSRYQPYVDRVKEIKKAIENISKK